MNQHLFRVSANDDGKRLDIFLQEQVDLGLSRSQIKNLVELKNVSIDSKTILKPGALVKEGQQIEVLVPEPSKLNLVPQNVGIQILFEDSDIAVLYKPAGISTHPSHTESAPTVVHGLLYSLKELSSVGGVERPGIVHRLDKGTSGVLVVSKNDAAHLGLCQQFKDHSINRRYRVLIYGNPQKKILKVSGKIETYFGRHPQNRKKMTSRLNKGRKAITNWKMVEELGEISLLECKLETGRTHQIRVHLSEMGFPVVGDPMYGNHLQRTKSLQKKYPDLANACLELNHQMLHAYFLSSAIPSKIKKCRFKQNRPLNF